MPAYYKVFIFVLMEEIRRPIPATMSSFFLQDVGCVAEIECQIFWTSFSLARVESTCTSLSICECVICSHQNGTKCFQ